MNTKKNRFGRTAVGVGPASGVPVVPTIRDIARAAGVSPTTVSVVINGHQREARISDETVQRVWQAVQQYRYRPDHSARSLRRRATQLIGVAVSWLRDPFYPELSACIGQVCREHGYGMFLTDLPDWVESSADQELGNSSVDGVILVDTRRSPWHPGGKVADPAHSAVPTVMVMGQEWLVEWQLPLNGGPGRGDDREDEQDAGHGQDDDHGRGPGDHGADNPHVVLLQTEQAGRLAARHLWERGYRRFVYVPSGFGPQLVPGHREFGFYDELRRMGAGDLAAGQPEAALYLASPPRLAAPAESGPALPYDNLAGYRCARAVTESSWWRENVAAGRRVGFYAANDMVGVQTLTALHEAGVHVPQQAGVVGTNGSQLGAMVFPPLTTVSLNVEAVAQQAVERLLQLIHGRTRARDDGGEGDNNGGCNRPRRRDGPQTPGEAGPSLLVRGST